MKKSVKILSAVMAVVLIFTCGVGATLAFIQHETKQAVVNTFVGDDILRPDPEGGDASFNIKEHVATPDANNNYTLTEALDYTNSYNVVPGATLEKDPFVHVNNKVQAYLFLEVVGLPLPDGMHAEVDTTKWTKMGVKGQHEGDLYYWTAGNGVIDVAPEDGQDFKPILKNDKVTVDSDFNPAIIQGDAQKTVQFYGYLTQANESIGSTPLDAWNNTFGKAA